MKPIRITQKDLANMLSEAKMIQEKKLFSEAECVVKLNNGKSMKMTGKEIAESLAEAVKKRVAEKREEMAEQEVDNMLESYRKAKAKAKNRK